MIAQPLTDSRAALNYLLHVRRQRADLREKLARFRERNQVKRTSHAECVALVARLRKQRLALAARASRIGLAVGCTDRRIAGRESTASVPRPESAQHPEVRARASGDGLRRPSYLRFLPHSDCGVQSHKSGTGRLARGIGRTTLPGLEPALSALDAVERGAVLRDYALRLLDGGFYSPRPSSWQVGDIQKRGTACWLSEHGYAQGVGNDGARKVSMRLVPGGVQDRSQHAGYRRGCALESRPKNDDTLSWMSGVADAGRHGLDRMPAMEDRSVAHDNAAKQHQDQQPGELRMACIGQHGEHIFLFSCDARPVCRLEVWPDGDRIVRLCQHHHDIPVDATLVRFEL